MTKNHIAIALIALGIVAILILAVAMMVLGQGLWATLLLGGAFILLGVIGLVIGRRPYPAGQGTATPTARQNPPSTFGQSDSHPAAPPPAAAASPAPAGAPRATEKLTSGGIRRITDMVSKAWNAKDFGAGRMSVRVMLIGSIVLVLIAVLLLCNLLVALRPWFTVHETQVVECRKASAYTQDGWQVVSSYSYEINDPEATTTTIYTACVIERERFVWTREERAEKTKKPEDDTIREITPDSSSSSLWATPTPTPQALPTTGAGPTTDAPPPSPTVALQPTATTAPTITPLPSATPRPTETLLPTVTPESPDSPLATPNP